MQALTQEELREVTIVIPHAKFERLPAEVWEYLRLYIGKETPQGYTYKIPTYLWQQLEAIGKGEQHEQA